MRSMMAEYINRSATRPLAGALVLGALVVTLPNAVVYADNIAYGETSGTMPREDPDQSSRATHLGGGTSTSVRATIDTLPATPHQKQVLGRFGELDSDQDGRLTAQEWQRYRDYANAAAGAGNPPATGMPMTAHQQSVLGDTVTAG